MNTPGTAPLSENAPPSTFEVAIAKKNILEQLCHLFGIERGSNDLHQLAVEIATKAKERKWTISETIYRLLESVVQKPL